MRLLLALLLALLPSPALATGGDVELYKTVAAEISDGAYYYPTVTRLHRERDYPLKPFVTVRPPALALIASLLRPIGLLVAAWALLALTLTAWFDNLRNGTSIERIVCLGLIAAGGGAFINSSNVYVHELWAGMLTTLALALRRFPKAQLLAALLAVVIRELAAPVLILLGLFGPRARSPLIFCLWTITLAYYGLHYLQVQAALLPTDPVSQGWHGLRGISGFADDISALVRFDVPVALCLLPLAGWAAFIRRDPLPFIWFGGVIAAVALFARADNLFWVTLLFPGYVAGIVFLKDALPKNRRPIRRLTNFGSKSTD